MEQSDVNNERCQICLNDNEDMIFLTCDHYICMVCAYEQVSKNKLSRTTFKTIFCQQCRIATVLNPDAVDNLNSLDRGSTSNYQTTRTNHNNANDSPIRNSQDSFNENENEEVNSNYVQKEMSSQIRSQNQDENFNIYRTSIVSVKSIEEKSTKHNMNPLVESDYEDQQTSHKELENLYNKNIASADAPELYNKNLSQYNQISEEKKTRKNQNDKQHIEESKNLQNQNQNPGVDTFNSITSNNFATKTIPSFVSNDISSGNNESNSPDKLQNNMTSDNDTNKPNNNINIIEQTNSTLPPDFETLETNIAFSTKILDIKETNTLKTTSDKKEEIFNMCVEHPDEICNQICTDDNKIVCAECIINGRYRQFNCIKLNRANEYLVNQINLTSIKANELKHKIELNNKIINFDSEDFVKKFTQCKSEINQQFDSIIRHVNEVRDQLFDKIDKRFNVAFQDMTSRKSILDLLQNSINEVTSAISQLSLDKITHLVNFMANVMPKTQTLFNTNPEISVKQIVSNQIDILNIEKERVEEQVQNLKNIIYNDENVSSSFEKVIKNNFDGVGVITSSEDSFYENNTKLMSKIQIKNEKSTNDNNNINKNKGNHTFTFNNRKNNLEIGTLKERKSSPTKEQQNQNNNKNLYTQINESLISIHSNRKEKYRNTPNKTSTALKQKSNMIVEPHNIQENMMIQQRKQYMQKFFKIQSNSSSENRQSKNLMKEFERNVESDNIDLRIKNNHKMFDVQHDYIEKETNKDKINVSAPRLTKLMGSMKI